MVPLHTTSVSILDARIKLLTIPRAHLNAHMHAVTRCLAFRQVLAAQRGRDPFFSLSLNAIELSVFGDEDLIDRVFFEEGFASGSIEVSEDIWIALQVEQHDDDSWDLSGGRVRDISAPLAAEGISILFLSTYISDFLLIKQYRLPLVTEILQRNSFYSHDKDDAGSVATGPRSNSPFLPDTPGSPLSPVSALQSPTMLSRSLTGSVLLSDRERSSSRRSATLESQSPTGSPHRLSLKARSGSIASALSSTRPLDSPSGLVSPLPPPDVVRNDPESAAMSAGSSLQSQLSADSSDKDSVNQQADAGRPRSYEEMQQSMMSDSSTASGIVDNISLLPDELVCIGLSMQHEQIWRAKLVHALFYYEDVLPPLPGQKRFRPMSKEAPAEAEDLDDTDSDDEVSREVESLQISPTSEARDIFSTTPTARMATSGDRPQPLPNQRTFSTSTDVSTPAVPLVSTRDADYPTPFMSLTLTVEGGSLIADIRLLRALFEDQDESIVYASGQGGLFAPWSGEETSSNEHAQNSHRDENRGRPLLQSPGSKAVDKADELDHDSIDSDEEVESSELENRRLFKCLQLDLSSFGLEKAGLVHQFAGLLTDESINLLYSATYRTANILVSKRHIRKARVALESGAK